MPRHFKFQLVAEKSGESGKLKNWRCWEHWTQIPGLNTLAKLFGKCKIILCLKS